MTSYAADINKLMLFLSELREISSTMQAQQAMCLLSVAVAPGLTASDMSRVTGLGLSSISRNVNALSRWNRHGEAGYDLVEQVDDPVEPRRKIFFLNQRGRAKLQKIITILRSDEAIIFDSPTAAEAVERSHRHARR